MNRERVEELELIANKFNERLNKAHEEYERKHSTKLNSEKNPLKQFGKLPSISSSSHKEKTISNQMFKELEPWRPTFSIGRYFEGDFKKLEHKYVMNNWEHVRVPNMLPRSYAKIGPKFECKKDVIPPFGYGTSFDTILKRSQSTSNYMANYTSPLINKFIEQNQKKEKILKEIEDEDYKMKHQKHEIEYNKWLPVSQVGKEFSKFSADTIHSFRVDNKKRKFLVEEPFRIPKKEGDYFYNRELEKENQLHY